MHGRVQDFETAQPSSGASARLRPRPQPPRAACMRPSAHRGERSNAWNPIARSAHTRRLRCRIRHGRPPASVGRLRRHASSEEEGGTAVCGYLHEGHAARTSVECQGSPMRGLNTKCCKTNRRTGAGGNSNVPLDSLYNCHIGWFDVTGPLGRCSHSKKCLSSRLLSALFPSLICSPTSRLACTVRRCVRVIVRMGEPEVYVAIIDYHQWLWSQSSRCVRVRVSRAGRPAQERLSQLPD